MTNHNDLPRGWKCKREANHEGPCAAKCRWWNLHGWYLLAMIYVHS